MLIATQVNLYEAKTQLSSHVDRAAQGEEIVIAKAGRPFARLMPLGSAEAIGARAFTVWSKFARHFPPCR